MEQIQYLIDRLESIDKKFDEKLDKILVQTTKTNGRVSAIEKTVNEHDDQISEHEKSITFNKGRDKVWWIVVGAACAVLMMLLQYFLFK